MYPSSPSETSGQCYGEESREGASLPWRIFQRHGHPNGYSCSSRRTQASPNHQNRFGLTSQPVITQHTQAKPTSISMESRLLRTQITYPPRAPTTSRRPCLGRAHFKEMGRRPLEPIRLTSFAQGVFLTPFLAPTTPLPLPFQAFGMHRPQPLGFP